MEEALVGLIILPYPADVGCIIQNVGEQTARQIGTGGRSPNLEEFARIYPCLAEESRRMLAERFRLSFEADLQCVVESLDVESLRELEAGGRQPDPAELDRIRQCLPGEGQPQLARSVFGLQPDEVNCVRDTLGRTAIREFSLGLRGPEDHELAARPRII